MDQIFGWQLDRAFGTSYAEHVFIGPYELVAFDLRTHAEPRLGRIGWELFSGDGFRQLLARGDSSTFEEAKASAEASYARIIGNTQ